MRLLFLVLVFAAGCLSLWSLMWLFSSTSLASEFCSNSFSLFHEEFRCRQPYLAVILLISSLSLGGFSIYSFLRIKKFKGNIK